MTLPGALLRSLAGIVGEPHVLTGDATAGFAVDWTGRFQGHTPAVVRPRDTAEVAAVLALCTDAGLPVVPQGGNTGLVGGGVPRHGEVMLSLTRLNQLGPVDHEAAQVTAGAGVTGSSSPAGAAPPSAERWRPMPAGCESCASGRCARSCAVSKPSSPTAPWCRT